MDITTEQICRHLVPTLQMPDEKKYDFGVVACNNGDVYVYSSKTQSHLLLVDLIKEWTNILIEGIM